VHVPSGDVVALKTIQKKFMSKKGWTNLSREIEIMLHLAHPNILKMREIIDKPNEVHLILEFISGGELFDQIVSRGSFGEKDARKIVKQILTGIGYLHELGVAHRDLKPENLLCSIEDDRVVVSDFGLAKIFSRGELLKTHCGTPHYAAPEIVRGDLTYDMMCDMWSIGVISFVLLSGCFPFHSGDEEVLKKLIVTANFTYPSEQWSNISDKAKHFIRSLLLLDASKRLTAAQALQHPWIHDETVQKQIQSSIFYGIFHFQKTYIEGKHRYRDSRTKIVT